MTWTATATQTRRLLRPRLTIRVRTLLFLVMLGAVGLAGWREYQRRLVVAKLMAILGPTVPDDLPVCGTGARYLGPFPLADRIVAVHAEDLAAPQLVKTYRDAINQQDDCREKSALHALLRIEPLAAVSELKRKREHGRTRQDKSNAISWMAITASSYEELAPLLRTAMLEALDDPDPMIGSRAAEQLADILVRDDDIASLEKLADLLHHPSEQVRVGAARLLAERGLKPGESLLALRERLRESDRAFARLLEKLREEALPVLYPPPIDHP
ncbi:MAG TPA: hypothetical protein VGZ22_11140 [Isosphaeraceae bacterium]|jgi:hypothetical protein|nr:hypothetical protein [Isosphaeraceae bacterium]